MTLNLSNYVSGGEIINTQRNSVHGYLALRDCDRSILLQLTGNCRAELAGKHMRFETRPDSALVKEPVTEAQMDDLHLGWIQIGVPGEMSVSFDPSVILLEWHSQNGRTVIELKDAFIEFVDEEEPESESLEADEVDDLDLEDESDPDFGDDPESDPTAFDRGDDAEEASWDAGSTGDADNDPFGLFPPDLDAQLGAASPAAWNSEPDEATLAQWKEWDEVFEGTRDVPLSSLFDPPIQLPPSQSLDDQQVDSLFNTILRQLALHNVAIHMCEHYTPRCCYDLLLQEILPQHGTHPELPRIGYTMNFDTSEFCDECQAEFDRRYEQDKANRKQSDSDDDFGGETRGGEPRGGERFGEDSGEDHSNDDVPF